MTGTITISLSMRVWVSIFCYGFTIVSFLGYHQVHGKLTTDRVNIISAFQSPIVGDDHNLNVGSTLRLPFLMPSAPVTIFDSSHRLLRSHTRNILQLQSERSSQQQKRKSSRVQNNDDTEESNDITDVSKQRRKGLAEGAGSGIRWNSLSPKAQNVLRKAAQARAIENKKKREPSLDKKQRMYMFFKKAQRDRKMASRVKRPLNFTERTPLVALPVGSQVNGTVISLTPYGAYVDVGSDCDGLLHISQLSRDIFVQHPRQILSPGQNVTVWVTSINPSMKKIQLSMLSSPPIRSNSNEHQATDENGDIRFFDDDDEDVIRLEELNVDDELWGEIVRVTDYGAYIDVGAEVEGFLHFMDHPLVSQYQHPREYMTYGQRVRVWVSNLEIGDDDDDDADRFDDDKPFRRSPRRPRRRIKLTAVRPPHLPGPRRDLY